MRLITAAFRPDLGAYVNSLYRHLLQREPAQQEVDNWARVLKSQRDLGVLLAGFTDSKEYKARFTATNAPASPFEHFNSKFDAREVMRRHAVPDIKADPRYLTNFIGVLIDPKYCRPHLDGSAGLVEPIPIPANWHADIAEWGAALRAVDLARDRFTIIELGCGWGCWMNNTGAAARRRNLKVRLIGIDGDPGHVAFAEESTAVNGFAPSEVVLHHGIASALPGTALFLRTGQSGESYGSMPIFNASDAQRVEALRTGSHDVLPMIPLADLTASEPRIDLLHVDIQGGEADLIAGALDVLSEKVAYLLIGTHSRQIEGRLFDTLLTAGWELDIERPALLSLSGERPVVTVDGVQGWRNPGLQY